MTFDVVYTVSEVSKILKTNTSYVYKLIEAGLLPVLKLGRIKIRRVSLLKFLRTYEGMDLTEPNNIIEIKKEVI